mgnify:CR=1 FL=1
MSQIRLEDSLVTQLLRAVDFNTPSMIYLDHDGVIVLESDDGGKRKREEKCKYFNTCDKENLWLLIKFCHKVLSHMNANGDVRLGEHSNGDNWEYDQYNLGKDIGFIYNTGKRLCDKFFKAEMQEQPTELKEKHRKKREVVKK